MSGRVLVWFSSGAASAVAAKVAVERYRGSPLSVEVVNVDMDADEHEDNARFRRDVAAWIGQEIIQIRSPKYQSTEDVFLTERYIAGVFGAACTKRLKGDVYAAYERLGDWHVVGFTADERDRIVTIEQRKPGHKFLWLLSDVGIHKEDCYHILSAAGIELPAMYRMGYGHNNCIGCVKGGMGYWNKIRRDFPAVFRRRAEIEREVGASIINGMYLDQMGPNAGRDVPEPKISCGLFCEGYADLIQVAAFPALKERA